MYIVAMDFCVRNGNRALSNMVYDAKYLCNIVAFGSSKRKPRRVFKIQFQEKGTS